MIRTTRGSSWDGKSELGKILLREIKLALSWRPGRGVLPDLPPRLTVTGVLSTGVIDLAQVGRIIARVIDSLIS